MCQWALSGHLGQYNPFSKIRGGHSVPMAAETGLVPLVEQ